MYLTGTAVDLEVIVITVNGIGIAIGIGGLKWNVKKVVVERGWSRFVLALLPAVVTLQSPRCCAVSSSLLFVVCASHPHRIPQDRGITTSITLPVAAKA